MRQACTLPSRATIPTPRAPSICATTATTAHRIMGCFQSKNAVPAGKAAAALAQEAALAREADATRQAAAVSAHASAMLEQQQQMRQRPQSEVMRRAGAFDKLDAEARAAPQLKEVPDSIPVGERNSKLLQEFERREAEARAAPVLRDVRTTDVRNSKIFGKLQEFEANDARAAAEPKLEKTFSQREGERSASRILMAAA